MRKITDVQFNLKGQRSAIDGKQWAQIKLSFTSDDDHVRDIAVSLLVSSDPDKTLLALHEESRGDAIETLKAALGALEQHGISMIAQHAAENQTEHENLRSQAAQAEIEAAMKNL